MLVALTVTALAFLAALSLLAFDNKLYRRDDAAVEAAREARYVLDRIQRDLLLTGYGIDSQTMDPGADGTAGTTDDLIGQPKFVYAAPYELVINADTDGTIKAIRREGGGSPSYNQLPTGYYPVTYNSPAETIRYTLDSDGNGTVNASDRGDESEESVTANTGLWLLRRELWGVQTPGVNNVKQSFPIGLIRGPGAYYSGGPLPQPLFTYWGYFTRNDRLQLWGDSDGNGVLSAAELAALGPVTAESASDRNGDGDIDRRITTIVRKVDVHVTTETPFPDMDYRDPLRSGAGSTFRYHTVALTTSIEPRNLDLPGGACGGPPAAPSGLGLTTDCGGTPKADGKVRLVWALSTDDGAGDDDVDAYWLYRTTVYDVFGSTPYATARAGDTAQTDQSLDLQGWPPKQYWYRVRSLDCTPNLSKTDTRAGAYPAAVGPSYPLSVSIDDVPADTGNRLDVSFAASPDDPANTTGYGGAVTAYYVHRSQTRDYRCVAPIHSDANRVNATGATSYVYQDRSGVSTSAPVFGELYYYWLRAANGSNLSPYSPTYCNRPSQGPVHPVDRHARMVNRGAGDRPAEIWLLTSRANTAASYDHYQLRYRIYRSSTSKVDDAIGYTDSAAHRVADAVAWTGIIWVVGGGGGASQRWTNIKGGSTGPGSDWKSSVAPASPAGAAVSFGSRTDGIVVGAGGMVAYTTTGGASWTAGVSGVSDALNDVTHVAPQTAIAVGASGRIIRTTNGGASWTTIASGTAQSLRAVAAPQIDAYNTSSSIVIAVGDSATALRSTDGGLTFSPIAGGGFTGDLKAVCAVTEANGAVTVWVGGQYQSGPGPLYKSANGGASWSGPTTEPPATVTSVACAPGGAGFATTATAIHRMTDSLNWPVDGASGKPTVNLREVTMFDANSAWLLAGNAGSTVVHRRSGGAWASAGPAGYNDGNGLAARPEIAWEDAATAGYGNGTAAYYVVTSRYNVGNPSLDGESGMFNDRPGTVENPDDTSNQILVDSCNSIELPVTWAF